MSDERRFAFRLALALGQSNPDAMLARMPHRVWLEWGEYAAIEPFDGEWADKRADWRAGMQAATVANCLGRKKGQKAFKPDDFMPKIELRKKKQQTPDDLLNKVIVFNQLFGGMYIDAREDSGDTH